MLLALGAVSSAMDALQSLTSSKASSPHSTGFRHISAKPFELASSSEPGSQAQAAAPRGFTQLSPETINALLAAQGQASSDPGAPPTASRSGALNHLFATLDADGSGRINKTEFGEALGAGGTNTSNANDVFGRLDKDGDGSVTLGELVSALRGGKRPHHHPGAAGESSDANASNSSDPLLQASGASSTSISNSDGSTTTSVTYAHGSKVTMIPPAAKTASGGAASSYNLIEQMIAREAQAIASGASTSLSLKV